MFNRSPHPVVLATLFVTAAVAAESQAACLSLIRCNGTSGSDNELTYCEAGSTNFVMVSGRHDDIDSGSFSVNGRVLARAIEADRLVLTTSKQNTDDNLTIPSGTRKVEILALAVPLDPASGRVAGDLTMTIREQSASTGVAIKKVTFASCRGHVDETEHVTAAALPRFHYDAETGVCKDASGASGYNAFNPEKFWRSQIDGEDPVYGETDFSCVDFRGAGLRRFASVEGFGWIKLRSWNLRGANLHGLDFSFFDMQDLDLSGADFTDVVAGYTVAEGRYDRFSKMPSFCNLESDGTFRCRQ